MLGTAHSNNGINIVSLTFTGDAVPTYPQKFDTHSGRRHGRRGRRSSTSIRTSPTRRLMQANAAIEWQIQAQTHADGRPICSSTATSCRARSIATSARSGRAPSRWRPPARRYAYPFFGADRPFGNFQRVIAFESTAVSRYNGMTFELNRRFASDLQFRAAYTLGKVDRHRARRDRRRARQCRRRREVRVEPGGLRRRRTVGNNDQRHRFVPSGVYNTNGLAERAAKARRAR